MIRIRASMLPFYNDCPRKSLAQSYKKTIRLRGFKTDSPPKSIGAAVGQGVHSATEQMHLAKKNTGEPGKLNDAQEIGIQAFRQEINEGAFFDDVTPNKNHAEKQIQAMSRYYFHVKIPEIEVEDTELMLKAKINEEFLLTGKVDLIEKRPILHDTKTGKMERVNYMAQVGAYSLMMRSAGRPIEKILIDYLPRKSLGKKGYLGGYSYEYDKENSEVAAMNVIKIIIRDYEAFLREGDPSVVPANPNSMLCSSKFCPAYGTDFCEYTKGKKEV